MRSLLVIVLMQSHEAVRMWGRMSVPTMTICRRLRTTAAMLTLTANTAGAPTIARMTLHIEVHHLYEISVTDTVSPCVNRDALLRFGVAVICGCPLAGKQQVHAAAGGAPKPAGAAASAKPAASLADARVLGKVRQACCLRIAASSVQAFRC